MSVSRNELTDDQAREIAWERLGYAVEKLRVMVMTLDCLACDGGVRRRLIIMARSAAIEVLNALDALGVSDA